MRVIAFKYITVCTWKCQDFQNTTQKQTGDRTVQDVYWCGQKVDGKHRWGMYL